MINNRNRFTTGQPSFQEHAMNISNVIEFGSNSNLPLNINTITRRKPKVMWIVSHHALLPYGNSRLPSNHKYGLFCIQGVATAHYSFYEESSPKCIYIISEDLLTTFAWATFPLLTPRHVVLLLPVPEHQSTRAKGG